MATRRTRRIWKATRFFPLVFSMLLMAGSTCTAEPTEWFARAWQTDDGLPNNHVGAIVQGPDGFLWVGTAVGLVRFDGIRFTKFPYAAAPNGDEAVSSLSVGTNGGVWIRMRSGSMTWLSPNLSQVLTPAGLPNSRAMCAVESNDGRLWVAFPDSVWTVENGKAARLTGLQDLQSDGLPGGFAEDSNGDIWLAKGNGAYIFREGRFQAVATTTYKTHLASSRTHGVWIAAGKQLFKCDCDGKLRDCGAFFPADSHAGSTTVMEDHTGAVWVGTSSGGLFRYTEAGFEQIETSHPNILSLAEDREGNIWAGTAGGGLNRISPRRVQLEGLDTGSSLVAIQCLCEDSSGTQWGVTQNGLLVMRENEKWKLPSEEPPWTNAVDCVAADSQGSLWIGTRNSGLWRRRDGRYTNWGPSEGFRGHVVLYILPASNGDIWIAEQAPTALQCLHDDKLRSLKLPKNMGRLTALAEDQSKRIWAGSQLNGLMRVEGDSLLEVELADAPERSVLSLCATDDGAMWFGFEGAGLGRVKDGRFCRVESSQGLFDDYISQIIADSHGWFWFGSERGIFKARQDELEAVLDGRAERAHSLGYGRNEGLFSMEADSANINPYVCPAAQRSRDGRLWIPMRKSLAAVDPNAADAGQEAPPVLLSQVTMDGRVIGHRGGLTDTNSTVNLLLPGAELRLPPGHRHLQFDFTAIHFSAPENIRFRYQLVGYDSDWIETLLERNVGYSRLAHARYQFRVQAAIGNGPWSESPATLTVTVAPFVWQTWWFRIGAALLFSSCLIALVRYISFRRLQAEMRALEQHAALDKERTRIARDLHDDLGCSLNRVALTLDMAQRTPPTLELANGKLEQCSSLVRQAARSVDEIVWAINPRNDTLHYMVDYISQFAVEFLHAANISPRVDLPDQLPNRHITPEARHNLFLVVKEALNNIARHARATEVRLRITATEKEVAIVIQDNGRGFENAPDNGSCDGLRNMRQRMEEIGGGFQLASRPGEGTRVDFVYGWPGTNGI